MNEKMQENLNRALEGLINTISDTSFFIKGELPDVVNQLLQYKFYEHLTWFIIGLIFLSSVVYANVKSWKSVSAYISNTDDPSILFIYAINIIPSIIFFHMMNLRWLMILIAPKLYIIEYLKLLIS